MPDDAFTQRQRTHAENFQQSLQALSTSLPAFDATEPPSRRLADSIAQTITALEQLSAAMPDPVYRGKIGAVLHILRSISLGQGEGTGAGPPPREREGAP